MMEHGTLIELLHEIDMNLQNKNKNNNILNTAPSRDGRLSEQHVETFVFLCG